MLIADDHAVAREGLKAILDREVGLRVNAHAVDGRDAVRQAMAADLDLAILDLSMPRLTGIQAAREISRSRDLPILILSMHDREQYCLEAIAAGAAGYLLKREADRDIVSASHAVLRQEPFVCPSAMKASVRRHVDRIRRGELPGTGPLSARETEIVKRLAEGHTSQVIANLLTISPKTVGSHHENILEKLRVRDLVDITRDAIRAGLIEP